MNTIDRELTEEEQHARDGMARAFDDKYGRPMSPREWVAYHAQRESRRGMGSGNVFNGSTRIIGWLLGINALLIAAAITGGIQFAITSSGRLSAMEAKMEMVMVRLK
jgi:hypothetical protein